MDSGENVTLRAITADEMNRWDALVEASSQGTIFHTWPWVSAMAKHGWLKLMHEKIKPVFHPLIAEHGGRDIGLIPLYEFCGRFIRYTVSPPPHTFVTYLGPCLNFPEGMKQAGWERLHRGFQNAVDAYLSKLGTQCTWMRTPPGYDDMRPYLWLGYNVTPMYNYILDTRRPVDAIMRASDNFPNKLRRFDKEGYTTRLGSFNDVEKLFHQQKSRLNEQSISMGITLAYLQDLWDSLHPEKMRIFVVEKEGEYVSAAIDVSYKAKVTAWLGMQKVHSKGISPNMLIQWEAIRWAATNGYAKYEDLGALEERLNEFKARFNPGLNRYYNVVRMDKALSLAYETKRVIRGGNIFGVGL
jgi:hypothetical protein